MSISVCASDVKYKDFCAFRDAEAFSITWKSQDQRMGLYYPVPDLIVFAARPTRLVVWTDNGRSRPSDWLLEILMLPYVWKGIASPSSFAASFRNYLTRHFKYVPDSYTLQWDFWLYSFLEDGQSREQLANELHLPSPLTNIDRVWDWSKRLDPKCVGVLRYLAHLTSLDHEMALHSYKCWCDAEEERRAEELRPAEMPLDPEDELREEVRQYQQGIDYENIHSD